MYKNTVVAAAAPLLSRGRAVPGKRITTNQAYKAGGKLGSKQKQRSTHHHTCIRLHTYAHTLHGFQTFGLEATASPNARRRANYQPNTGKQHTEKKHSTANAANAQRLSAVNNRLTRQSFESVRVRNQLCRDTELSLVWKQVRLRTPTNVSSHVKS